MQSSSSRIQIHVNFIQQDP